MGTLESRVDGYAGVWGDEQDGGLLPRWDMRAINQGRTTKIVATLQRGYDRLWKALVMIA